MLVNFPSVHAGQLLATQSLLSIVTFLGAGTVFAQHLVQWLLVVTGLPRDMVTQINNHFKGIEEDSQTHTNIRSNLSNIFVR